MQTLVSSERSWLEKCWGQSRMHSSLALACMHYEELVSHAGVLQDGTASWLSHSLAPA